MARIAIDARKLSDFGIGTYVRQLLAGLDGLEGDEEYLVFLRRPDSLPRSSSRFVEVRVRARNYGLAEHFVLPWITRRQGAHLYHAPHYVLPWLAARPAVVTIHDLIHLHFPEYLPGRGALVYARAMMRHAYGKAARVLTVSESSKRDLLAAFGGSEERVVVVPNAIDDDFFDEPSPDELASVRERWSLPECYVLYSGSLKPHKNLERLVRAFARVRRAAECGDPKLVLIGSSLASHHELRLLAAELGVREHLRALGWMPRPALRCVYRLATVFAYPSLYEGFGLPPLEAMASQVPVVASNRASLPEVCGDAAILVDPTDVEALAVALLSLLRDEHLRKRLVAAGADRAQRFRKGPAEATLAVYRSALA